MSYYVKVLCCFVLSFCFSTSYSWNAVGHYVIGNIAYQNLTPAVRNKIDNLIAHMHNEYPTVNTMDALSQWPDSLYAQRIRIFAHWHYIDIPYSPSGRQENRNLVDSDNAVWALKSMTSIIKNEKANQYERARFLSFYIHIMGDIHQPLHTVSYVSKQFPEGDKGGNLYRVLLNDREVKLHGLWDSACGSFGREASSHYINSLASRLIATYPKAYFGSKIKDVNFDNWLKEGMQKVHDLVYQTPFGQPVTANYLSRCKVMAEASAALAGYRIAEHLNQLLA